MQQSKCDNINEYCNELEILSSKMADFISIGNYNEIYNIDLKRKTILKEISKDVSNLSKANKKKLKLVWVNNKVIIDKIQNNISLSRINFIKKKKVFIAYNENSENNY